MKRVLISIVVVVGLGAGVGYLVTGGGVGPSQPSAGFASVDKAVAGGGGAAVGVPVGQAAHGPVPEQGAAQATAAPPETSGGGASAFGGSPVPAIGPEIVKTAQLSVQVPKGSFQREFDQATSIAGTFNGFVESSTQSQGDKSQSGTLLIRVPSANFDAAKDALLHLGTPDSVSVSGQDVSSQFVDLEARLRTWEAQEAVFLRLMHRANSVSATLQIQRQLQDVQFQIEQIKGELHQLHDQTTMATIDVTIHEPGIAVPRPEPVKGSRPSLSEAWSKALNGVLGVTYTVVVGLGYLLPIGVLVLIGMFLWRRVVVRPQRPTEQSAPAA